ncbi:MAG: hypothetical protein ABIZ80_21675 [Bryobacteraceae bacterium]
MRPAQAGIDRGPYRKLRIAVAALILLVLVIFGVRLLPLYLQNMKLQTYVEQLTAAEGTRPDDLVRIDVLQKAALLGLPVKEGDVRIKRSNETLRIDVRYFVRVDLPLYTVDLHFYPGAGSR